MKPLWVWIGLVILALGVLGVLDATGTLESTETVERWWPAAIVGAGLIAMVAQRRISLGPVFIAAIGVALLAETTDWASEDVVGPAILVVIGLAVLIGATKRGRTWSLGAEGSRPVAIFGGSEIKDRSEHFTHGEATALFGGATLDLREAHFEDRATVDATAIFGGVDVLVPKDIRVTVGGLPIFGGYDDKTHPDSDLPPDAPRLDVRATAIFGGVDVANEPD